MKIFYDSPQRFQKRIVSNWVKSGFNYNHGNVQLLRFAWIAKKYWSNRNGEKVAQINKLDTNQLQIF